MTEKNKGAQSDPVQVAINAFGSILDRDTPNAAMVLRRAQEFLDEGDIDSANRCQRLNYILHNSSLPNSIKLGEGARFAYGGIGLIVHKDSEIGKHACIGSNVTIGGRSGSKGRRTSEGKISYVPLIDDHAFISTGACILGGIIVGKMAIVGANSVVLHDVAPLSIVAGQPSKVISEITPENALKYKGTFSGCRDMTNEQFIAYVTSIRDNRDKEGAKVAPEHDLS